MSAAFLALALVSAAPEAPKDWGATLRLDASAMHKAIAENHPGPFNPADPGFAARNDRQWQHALKRAKTAQSFADYFYAMQEYAAAFDDGHLSYGVFGATPDNDTRWPGFLTRYDGHGNQVAFVSELWSGVPLGARLVSCDGVVGDEVSKRRIGSRFGRWSLKSQRLTYGAMTFLDTGNPYVGTLRRCRFDAGGRTVNVPLDWRPVADPYERFRLFPEQSPSLPNWRRLANGTIWVSLPTFDGNPDNDTGKALRRVIDDLDSNGSSIRSAPAIVFDLRGNGGGSSDWSRQIAALLWGEGAMQRRPEAPMIVSWRASKGNLDWIRSSFVERSKGGHLSPEVTRWYRDTISGLERALAEHDDLWVIKPERVANVSEDRPLPVHQVRGSVYVLTNAACMSACLDAVDLWTRLGAIPIGQETDADTLYMEARQVRLPAGVGAFSMPMKFYSGRTRGSNEPVTPRYRFDGDISDTAALEAWVATLR